LTIANLLKVALLTPRACGAASLMARCATPDVEHPISFITFFSRCGEIEIHISIPSLSPFRFYIIYILLIGLFDLFH
jgi:hypothetical protein